MPETDPGSGRIQINKEGKKDREPRFSSSMDRPGVRHTMDKPDGTEAADSGSREARFTSTVGADRSPEASAGAVEKGSVETVLGAASYTVSEVEGRIFAEADGEKVDVTGYFGAEQVLDRFQPADPDNKKGPLVHTETVKIVGTQRVQMGPNKGQLQIFAERVGGAGGRISVPLSEIGQRSYENGRSWRLPQEETRR